MVCEDCSVVAKEEATPESRLMSASRRGACERVSVEGVDDGRVKLFAFRELAVVGGLDRLEEGRAVRGGRPFVAFS